MFFLQMSGFPGSGKSTLSRLIAKDTRAIIVDHDIVKTAMLESMDETVDTKRVGGIAYHVEWALIDFHLSQGHSLILDSPCLYQGMIERGTDLTKKYDAQYKYIECFIDDFNEIDRRLKTRQRMPSQIHQVPAEEAFKKALSNSQKPSEDVKWLRVYTSRPVETYIDEVLSYIREYDK